MESENEMMEVGAPRQENEEAVRGLLTLARQLINERKPLQAVVVAMKSKGGDEAAFQSLHLARELYRSRLQENAAVDQLASLFAECAIAEAEPVKIESSANNITSPSITLDARGTSILAETSRMQVVLDAVSDGSSFICSTCGGLVSNHRKDEHYAYWCFLILLRGRFLLSDDAYARWIGVISYKCKRTSDCHI